MACAAVGHLRGHTDTVLCCEVSPSKQQLASGSEDGSLRLFDLRTHTQTCCFVPGSDDGEAILSVTHHPKDDTKMFVACGDHVLGLDLRFAGGERMQNGGDAAAYVSWQISSTEEVNQVVVDAKGKFLAAADDSGDVTVFDLHTNQVKRRLSGIHSNIASSVSFRPHRPWEVCSGGLDSVMVRWDFSSGKRLQLWDMGLEAVQDGSQMFNPPHVNSISVPQTEKRPFCRMVAAARGDGTIAMYDADVTAKSAKAPTRGSSRKQRASKDQENAASTSAQPEADRQGLLCLLDRAAGGHTSAAAHVTFPQWSQGGQVLSGGNDCRFILWDWERAQANSMDGKAPTPSTDTGGEAVLHSQEIGSKVNWLTTRDEGAENLYIADTTDTISIFSLK